MLSRLNQNPVAITELTHLRRAHTLKHKGYFPLYALLALSVVAAGLPLWFYITIDYTRLLAALAVIIMSTHFFISGRTVVLAAHAITHDWDAMIKSGLNARQVVWGKWWAVVRHVWRWHLFAALIKFGLALALAQHVYNGAYHDSYSDYFNLIDYPNLGAITDPIKYPSLIQCMVALLILLGFGLMQALLMASIGIVSGLIAQKRYVSPTFMALVVYLSLLALINSTGIKCQESTASILHLNWPYYLVYSNNTNELYVHVLITRVVALNLLGVSDGGIGISSDFLRPWTSYHLLRPLITGVLSISLQVSLLRFNLWIGRHLSINQGLTPISTLRERMALWLDTPITRYQWRIVSRRRESHRWRHIGFLCGLILAFVGTSITNWYPITSDRVVVLQLIIIVLTSTQLIITTRTAAIASHSLRSENSDWDTFALTGIYARQLILGKWWVTLRQTAPYHALIGCFRLGLACGLLQYLWTVEPPYTRNQEIFSYLTSNFAHYSAFKAHMVWGGVQFASDLEGFSYIASILVSFGLLDAAFVTSLGILASLIWHKNPALQMPLTVCFRIVPVILVLLFFYMTPTLNIAIPWSAPAWTYANTDQHVVVLDTLHMVVSPMMDGGMASIVLTRSKYTVYRAGIALALGAGLYIALTWLTLWAAQKIAIRRGALPPPEW